ncbi:hypothetical protein ACVWZW_008175 [Bradyrhizobium sp. F1.13.4]
MLPDIVTFWHGPMDALRQTCLRSQLAAGHKVTVYSFDTIPGLPAGIANADAEAILPHAFSERLRPPQPDGSWRDWTTLQFSDFFRMKLMAKGLGLWLDADVLLLRPVEIDPAKPYFAWERPRQLGNSVIYLPPEHGIVAAFEELMEQEELTPNWLSLRHRVTFAMRRLRGGSNRLSDIRVAIFGPAALTALARVGPASCKTHCRSNRSTPCMPSQSCSSIPRAISASSPTATSSACTSRPRAAAARSRSRAACMRGRRSGLGNSPLCPGETA